MRRLSSWAKANRWPARIIMILLHFLLVCDAIYIGNNLRSFSLTISPVLNILAIVLYIAAVIAYPQKNEKKQILRRVKFYTRQKSCDFLLAFTGVFMICYLANVSSTEFTGFNKLRGAVVEENSNELPLSHKITPGKKSVTPYILSRAGRKALLKELRTEIKKAFGPGTSKGGRAALLILSILLAIGLLFIVASISCNLSCNGNEGAASVVLILGTATVIALLIVVIRKIYKPERKNENNPEEKKVNQLTGIA